MFVAAQLFAQRLNLLPGVGCGRHRQNYRDGISRAARYSGRMDPVTHLMTGAVLARAGFNRKAAYATLAMTLAAEVPDIDVLWSIKGPVAAFQHHRGWTHALAGVPLEAAVVVGAV